MKHEQFTVTIKLHICEGMKAKALEEIRKLRVFVLGGNGTQQNAGSVFDHATVVKVSVDHEEINEDSRP